MTQKTITIENKENDSVKLSIIWAIFMLGVCAIIGTAWGKLGLQPMFTILGAICGIYLIEIILRGE